MLSFFPIFFSPADRREREDFWQKKKREWMWPSFWTFIFHEFVCSWESGNRRAFPPQMSLRLCPFFRFAMSCSTWRQFLDARNHICAGMRTHHPSTNALLIFASTKANTKKKEKTPAVLHKISAHPRIFFFLFVYFIISWRSSFIFFFSFLELFECRHEKKKNWANGISTFLLANRRQYADVALFLFVCIFFKRHM